MTARLVRCMLLLALGCATLTACGGDEPASPETRRSDLVRTTTEAPPPDGAASTATAPPDVSVATSTAEPAAAEPATATDAEPSPTADEPEAEATPEDPAAQIDWRNTTYLMRAYSGSDPEELSFTDGVAQRTVIVALQADPADPRRVAMVSTSADSEGFPLFVNAGIFTLDDGSGVARPEAEVSTMTGAAYQVHLCTAGLAWDGGDELSLEFDGCDAGDPGTLRWTRDGSTLVSHEEDAPAEDAGAGTDTGSGDGAGSGAGHTVDASSYGEVHFTSPSGAIECAMSSSNGSWAACHFPPEMDRAGVPGPDHCGTTTLAGVGAGHAAGWVCSGGAFAMPEVSGMFTAWFEDSGWEPAVSEVGGFERTTATVPYGSTLVLDNVRCRSAEDGMHCSHDGSGAGFSLARAGAQRHGPLTESFTELWE